MSICFWPAIQSVTAIPSSSPAGTISSDGQWTVVVADVIYNGGNVALPSGAAVGDVVEVHVNYVNFNTTPQVVAPSGESIRVTNPNQTAADVPCFCRKITSSGWSAIS